MISDLQRQRVADYQRQRERYMAARRQAVNGPIASARAPLATCRRWLPALLVAPFAVLAVAGALDLLYLLTGNALWTSFSAALIPAGVAGGVAAAAVGLRDWFALPAGSPARSVGVWFVLGTALVVTIFLQSWLARLGAVGSPAAEGVVLGFMGAAVALLAGWLLGEYLDRLAAITVAAQPDTPSVVVLPPAGEQAEPEPSSLIAHA